MKALCKMSLFMLFACLPFFGCRLDGEDSQVSGTGDDSELSVLKTEATGETGSTNLEWLQNVQFMRGYAISSSIGCFGVQPDGSVWSMFKSVSTIDDRGIFYVKDLGGNNIAIWSRSNAKWICCDRDLADGYGIPLFANRDEAGIWETFQCSDDFRYMNVSLRNLDEFVKKEYNSSRTRLYLNPNNINYLIASFHGNQGYPAAKVALQWQYNRKYVCSDLDYGSAGPLYSNRDAVGRWETFYLYDYGRDSNGNMMVALRSWSTGKFLGANAISTRLQADKEKLDSTTLFNIVSLEDYGYGVNSIALQSRYNGMYFRGDSFSAAQSGIGTGVALNVIGLNGF